MNTACLAPNKAAPGLLAALQGILDATPELHTRPPEQVRLWLSRWVLRIAFLSLAEHRRMLPIHNRIYRLSYSVTQILESLHLRHRQNPEAMRTMHWAYARLRSLCRLVHQGASHPALTLCGYGGDFFAESELDRDAPLLGERGPHDRALYGLFRALADPRLGLNRFDHSSTAETIGTLYQVLVGLRVLPDEGRLTLKSDESLRRARGTYYTPVALVEPLVEKVLGPLVAPNHHPATPESILALRILDPAVGSGTFLVAALRFLADHLAQSVMAHGRAQLVGDPKGSWRVCLDPHTSLEVPTDPGAEPGRSRLVTQLKRLISERCLHGVDLDPTAVEVARLALWMETLDPQLPFTFLDHAIKQGNSLVGAPLSAAWQYPLAAALEANSEWPDASQRPQRRARFLRFVRQQRQTASTPLLPGLDGPLNLSRLRRKLALTLERIHQMSEELPEAKKRVYEQTFLEGAEAKALRKRLDSWCALWFWPQARAMDYPGPQEWIAGQEGPPELVHQIAQSWRFFHWELEFPQVFSGPAPGFDAVLANPPWERPETACQESTRKGKGALRRFAEASGRPGGPLQKTYDRMTRTPDTSGLFCWQGESGYNLYQLFLERSIRWLKPQGRVGMVIPSGFSTDSGAAPLREALFQEMALEWLVSLTNRSKFFEIDSRFGFLALVGRKPGPTLMFRTASEQRDLRCFSRPESETPQVSKDILPRRSARNLLLPEFASSAEFVLLRRLLESHLPMDDRSQNGFGVTYRRELDMTSGTGKFLPAWQMQRQGFVADADGVWRSPDGHLALPLVQGASFHAFSPWAKEWHGAQQGAWKPLDNPVRPASPKLLVPLGPGETPALTRHKLVLRRLARNSDERTLLACVVPGYPCGDKAPSLTTAGSQEMLALCGLLNSLVLDWVCRSLGSGTNVDWHRVKALPLPDRSTPGLLDDLPPLVLALHPPHRLFEPLWRDLARHHAWLLEKAPLDWTVTHPESRRRLQAALDAKVAQLYGVSPLEFQSMLSGCELSCTQLATPAVVRTLPSRGFWRVDRQLPAEERRTNLAARWLQEPMLGYWSAKEILERCSMDYCWGAGADGAGAVAGAVSSSRHST